MDYLDITLPGIEANLALDEALLNEADEGRGGPVLRLWELDEYAVVLGSTCRFRDDVVLDGCRQDDVAISRRTSGGGTVVVGPGALNVAVVLRMDSAPGLSAVDVAQRFALDPIAQALRSLGYPVELLGLGDLTVDSRKFAGSAQRRLRDHFLVHTSILYSFALERIPRYTRLPARQPSYRDQRSHEDFLMNLDVPRDELVKAVRSAWNNPQGPAAIPEATVRELVAARYADPAWVGRL